MSQQTKNIRQHPAAWLRIWIHSQVEVVITCAPELKSRWHVGVLKALVATSLKGRDNNMRPLIPVQRRRCVRKRGRIAIKPQPRTAINPGKLSRLPSSETSPKKRTETKVRPRISYQPPPILLTRQNGRLREARHPPQGQEQVQGEGQAKRKRQGQW